MAEKGKKSGKSDHSALDKALQEILAKRLALKNINYNNPQYDEIEEQLHDMEDAFQVKYGEFLEDALQQVHEDHCPDSEVLMPIAYLGDGIFVDADKYPGKEVRLALMANPVRLVFRLGAAGKEEVLWSAK